MSRKGENIMKRKDGRWEARVIYTYDENGKAKYRYLYGKTYAEAKAKKAAFTSEVLRGNLQTDLQKTIQALSEEFLLHKKMSVKYATLIHYENLIRRYLLPVFGKLPLSKLNSSQIEQYGLDLLSKGKISGNGLSVKTVKDILSVFRCMLKYAVAKQYISENILYFSSPKYIPKQTEVLSKEERKRLENFILQEQDSYKIGVYLSLYMGLRIGELCALRWSDLDFEHMLLHVTRTLRRIAQKGKTEIMISTPKTNASLRTIPIPDFLKQLLLNEKQAAYSADSYVLTGTLHYIEPSNYYTKYSRWLKKLHIRHYSFHTLRHTFATYCIEKGFDPKSLAEILGHTDVRITLNRYVHPSMDMKRSYMESLQPSYCS